MKYKFEYAQVTSSGSRKVNEDSISVFEADGKLGLVLCDGLGGHGLGDVASRIVVDVFGGEFSLAGTNKAVISRTFSLAQEKLLNEQIKRNEPHKIKTTAVITIADERNIQIAHVGDSRAYVFGKNKVLKRTLDHSIPQMLALSKEITEQEIRNHPDRNMLLRVMGVEWKENQYEFMKPISLRKAQAVLLCSDGFWELIDEDCMCRTLQDAHTVYEWLDTMVKIVEINGKGTEMDNYSAIALWINKK